MSSKFLIIVVFAIPILLGGLAHAQKKLDLEDLTIKGELHNDDRIKLLARERNQLKNYVKYRTNYRNEIVEVLPPPAENKKDYSYP